MISINKDTVNNLVFTLTEKSQLPNPYYLFSFTNDSSGEVRLFNMEDISGYPRRFNEMELTETSVGTGGTCAYAFAVPSNSVSLNVDLSVDMTFSAVLSSGISSGSLVSVEYVVYKYSLGALVEIRTTTILAGGSDAMNWPAGTATYIVKSILKFDDGAAVTLILPYEVSVTTPGSYIITAVQGDVVWPSTFDCDTLTMTFNNPISTGLVRSLSPKWIDENGDTITTAALFDQDFPYGTGEFDLSWIFSPTISEWVDLPSGYNIDEWGIHFNATVLTAGDIDPTLGEVTLQYGFGKYEVYESSTPTLLISETTGRILEEGIYFVNGYPASMNHNNINDIYL